MKPTIIFDLGGVILPLDTEATRQKFLKYTSVDIQEWMKFGYPHQIIQKLELGKISEKEFFEELSDLLNFNNELYYLKEAWNAMLLPIPKENIKYLEKLRTDYQLILLSNTCETHIQCFEDMLLKHHAIDTLESLFDKVYYSCRIGLRKPNPKLFQKVIKDNKLDFNTTIYFDDTLTHIESAQQLNIQSYLYPQNKLLQEGLINLLPKKEKILLNT
ncbi:MAG: hydrolase [Bacteroidia bacterium]|nr:MAG: hydrolase [Bacteroidia bacterium]